MYYLSYRVICSLSPLLIHPPPPSTLFPYTPLFRSRHCPGGFRAAAAGFHLLRRHDGRLLCSSRGTASRVRQDRKSTRLNSSHVAISYAVFCLKKKTVKNNYF